MFRSHRGFITIAMYHHRETMSMSLKPHPQRVINEETIAINHDWVYNQTCRFSHAIHVIFNFFFISFDYIFELNTK